MERYTKFTHFDTANPIDPKDIWEAALLQFIWANYSERYRLYPAEADEMVRCHSIMNVAKCDH